MFKPKRVEAKNAAAIPAGIPRSQPQTVIHNAPSDAAKIFAWAVVILVSVPIAWYFLVYLFEAMEYRKPEREAAFSLVGLAVLLILTRFFGDVAERLYRARAEYNLAALEITTAARVEEARLLTLHASQPRPGESRLTEEDSLFCALLRVVMGEAYQHIYREPGQVQQYTKSDVKPWSRESNNGREIPGIGEVSFKMAGKVRDWLTKKGVIRKDEVNLERYRTMAHFEKLLEDRFYTPIQVNGKPLSPTLRTEVSFIEN